MIFKLAMMMVCRVEIIAKNPTPPKFGLFSNTGMFTTLFLWLSSIISWELTRRKTLIFLWIRYVGYQLYVSSLGFKRLQIVFCMGSHAVWRHTVAILLHTKELWFLTKAATIWRHKYPKWRRVENLKAKIGDIHINCTVHWNIYFHLLESKFRLYL